MSFIIPAIDLLDGKCVRLTEGVYDSSKVYDDSPVEVAKRFEAAGCSRLHLVDLDGARAGVPKNLSVLEKISAATDLVIDFSGGLRSAESIADAYTAGASLVSIGSAAVEQQDLFCSWVEQFGTERIILSADVRGEYIAVRGWERQTRVSLYRLLQDLLQRIPLQTVAVTDISKDGRLCGPSIPLYESLQKQFPMLKFIASGGVHSLSDLHELRRIPVAGVIIGKAIYEGSISLESLGAFSC